MPTNPENEYRAHLLKMWRANSELQESAMEHVWGIALRGFAKCGRGAVLCVDDGASGAQFFVPTESADLQFGAETRRLCEHYRPLDQCVLVACTNGETFPILMNR